MADIEVEVNTRTERGPTKKRRRVVISCTESRNKEAHCAYEAGAPTAREQETHAGLYSLENDGSGTPRPKAEPLSSMASSWGYAQTGASTLCFLQKIERASTADGEDALSNASAQAAYQDTFAIKEKYKGLIRLLPARMYIDQLAEIFFTEFNWQYYLVEPQVFHELLDQWSNLPFKVLSSRGPEALSPDLRVFPALLFEVIATALLVLPKSLQESFESLKYAANMTFEDLAVDYSETGVSIVNLFGTKYLSTTSIQVGFLRAAFLKYTANVTESWHTVGKTIRDAQELGMHRDALDPKPTSNDVESVLLNQWQVEKRRHLYMMLSTWDIHMCLILGRPGSLDWRHGLPTLPIDARFTTASDRSKTPVIPREEGIDPPTPLTRNLFLYKVMMPLRDVQDLESDGPCPRDFSKVQKIQQTIMEIHESTPAVFRMENPDKQWDSRPELHWLPQARYLFEQMYYFTLVALHRPYIFHREDSRVEVIKGSLGMLEMQRQMFKGLPPKSWKNFDAVTLIATIYILFPYESAEYREIALQHCHWTVERFATMKDTNLLAKSAIGVLRAVVSRLVKAIGNCAPPSSVGTSIDALRQTSETPLSTSRTLGSTPASSIGRGSIEGGFKAPSESVASAAAVPPTDEVSSPSFSTMMPGGWEMPQDGNGFPGLAPFFAMGDLIYKDLTVDQDADLLPPTDSDLLGGDSFMWQFEGGFGQDTVWQFLNQHQLGSNESG
ncbi:fungal specific transcription factor domain-containing [Trichoderma arundinaceum]|uniref:Fungal specific transcription factor domain-containing n=1 Tax=Trichoderma arundinaceum TaxID=490622 RepID=A0A395NVQ8_TRIAR|nr:fungal specific transcription factor domain-containing [Trichoderma arundinaceum]